MQTPPPPPGPPQTPPPHAYGYEMPPSPGESAALRAAVFTWITAGLTAALFTCFGTMFLVISAMPFDALVQQMQQGQMPPEQLEQLKEMRPILPAIGIATFLLFVLPALALIILGFGVKARRPVPMLTTQILLGILAGVLGLLALVSLIQNAAMGNAAGAICPLLLLGVITALSIYTLKLIQDGKRDHGMSPPRREAPRAMYETDDEPWNRHLR